VIGSRQTYSIFYLLNFFIMKTYFQQLNESLKTRFILGLILSFGCFFSINAQEEDTIGYAGAFKQELMPPNCTYPQVTSKTVVFYNDQSIVCRVQVNSDGLKLDRISLVQKGFEKQILQEVRITEGSSFIPNLKANQLYELRSTNSCGQPVVLADISTYPFRSGSDQIYLSNNLYRHISAFTNQKGEGVSLIDYVKNLRDVDDLEKSEFLQKYLLKGSPLPVSSIGKVPYEEIRRVIEEQGKGGGPCLCEFVLNQGAFAIPDGIAGNQSIDPMSDNNFGSLGNASKWWFHSNSSGPAKYHQLFTDGWKEKSNSPKRWTVEMASTSSSSNKSPFYAKLSYTFLCVNYPSSTPEECGCEKKIRVSAGYTSEVEAKATVKNGGGGQKESYARSQDYAALLITKDNINSLNDIQVLDAGVNVATANCSGGVATSAILNQASSVIGGVVQVIKAVKTGQIDDIGAGIQTLTTSVAGVFSLFETPVGTCEGKTGKNSLIQGGTVLTLKPNEPVSIVLLSGATMESGGRRSWDSRARVNSNFYLAGVLLGSNSSTGEDYCCTDYASQWIYASALDGVSNIQIPINNLIFQNTDTGAVSTVNDAPYSGNNVSGQSQIGHSVAEYKGCENKVPIYTFK
jgi:hypothetical protein